MRPLAKARGCPTFVGSVPPPGEVEPASGGPTG